MDDKIALNIHLEAMENSRAKNENENKNAGNSTENRQLFL